MRINFNNHQVNIGNHRESILALLKNHRASARIIKNLSLCRFLLYGVEIDEPIVVKRDPIVVVDVVTIAQ